MCTGVGECRKMQGGTMCPSFKATREEEHSTRGRANALRLAMSNQLKDGLTNEEVIDALDLFKMFMRLHFFTKFRILFNKCT